jgi:phosphonate transport system substrate-binding protein
MFRLIWILVFASLSLQLQAAPKAKAEESYNLGIFPYMAPRQTVEFYGPVAASIEAELKHPVRLESLPSFTDFNQAMKKHRFDIALIQPFDYPEVVEKLGYLPVAQFSVPLVTQFYVRDDSRYRKIADLRGSTIAMPPAPAANSRMAIRALYDNKLIPGTDVEVNYFNSHDSCIQQVWAGSASACATAKPPILVFEQRMQAKLRAIYDTPPIPHIMFVASPSLPAEQRAKLQALITGWNQTENGRAILKGLGFPGFTAPKPAEYAMMRNYDPAKNTKHDSPKGPKELILGVFPFLNTRQIAENFAPTLPALSKTAGMPVYLRTASSFESYAESISAMRYDIVIVQPFDYQLAVKHDYVPVASMKRWTEGSFFVLENSPYQAIADFKGQVIAMPPENSAQSHLGRHALWQAGLNPDKDVTIDYRKTHDSCLQQVQRNEATACITADIIPAMLPKEFSQRMRKVGNTEKIPGALFMVHKRIPKKIREALQAEILAWDNSEYGRKILQSMGLGDFALVNRNDYEHMPVP